MGSVNIPATPTTRATSKMGLATFSPARTQSYIIFPYVETYPATYGICQHNHIMGGTWGSAYSTLAGPKTSKFRSDSSYRFYKV
ncbi:unnamed protein product [Prunus brigantina]